MQTLMSSFLLVTLGALLAASCSASVSMGNEASAQSGSLDPSLCFDNIDGDGDGLVDCEDSDCCWACLPDCGGDPDCKGEDWVMSHVLAEEAK